MKIDFKSYDGTRLTAICLLPDQPKAAVLMMHGLPSNKDEWGFYKDMAAYLHKHNVASFRFDFRYNGESEEGSLAAITISEMVSDIEAAYWQFISKLPKGIPVSLVGTSCGGGVSIRWANIFQRKISQVFLNAPVLDYEYEVTGEKKNQTAVPATLSQKNLEILAKKKGLNPDIGYGYQMINEAHLFNIKKEFSDCAVPVTIFQGNEDTIVPLSLTTEAIEGFNKIELIIVEKANHGFAVEGDEDLTATGTKENHFFVYNEMLKRLS